MSELDVDDIWAQMQADHNVSRSSKKIKDLSSLQHEKQKPKKKAANKLDTSLQWMQGWSSPGNPHSGSIVPAEAKGGQDFESIKMTEAPSTLIDAIEEIPADTPETFLAYIQRDINCLVEDNLGIRQKSLQKLERILVAQIDSLSTDIIDAVTDALLKPLLKRLKDKSEKCRELSVNILRSLIENTSDLSACLAYVFPTLVSRLGCEDLDGVAHLPEVMRPQPEQKPQEIATPVEPSEEVRFALARFVTALLARCTETQVLAWIDEATGLLRAQCMDPYHEVKAVACETMISFCHNHTEMLLHFSLPMGRSLTSCLMHNHAKIRILALRALTAIFWCGVWKHNHEIVQVLMAWQDPNQVAVKAFYEADTKVNYMSTLSFDRHPAVRRFWFETLSYWLLRIPDKVDHEPYIFPYLLTGLCDENEEIALQCFWLIEKCGEKYEEDNEADLRKTVQYGFDYGWTYGGRAFVPFPLRGLWAGGGITGSVRRATAQGPDAMGEKEKSQHFRRDVFDTDQGEEWDLGEEVPLPARDYAWPALDDICVFRKLPRPRLGSRCWVRTNTRRYIKATFNDVVDFRDCTAVNAGRLLCMSLAYTEEGITEWLQPMFASLCKFFSGRAWAAKESDSLALQTYSTVCKLLGCYLSPDSYWEQLKSSLDMDTTLTLVARVANLKILALCLEGSVETLKSVSPPDPTLGLGRLEKVIPELISAMHSSDLLLAPTEESRKAMWSLLFSFLEPLQEHLTFSQVSELLFVALALTAKELPEDNAERANKGVLADIGDVVEFEEEELVSPELLDRALTTLSAIAGTTQKEAQFSLDDLDDLPAPLVTVDSDPRVAHKQLFEVCFAEILEHLDDSFEVFRSILYLSPVSILTSPKHSEVILKRLAVFGSLSSSPAVRSSSLALGIHLALRCAKLIKNTPSCASTSYAQEFIYKIFKAQSEVLIKSSKQIEHISYAVMMSGMLLWRRFLTCPDVTPRDALFGVDENQPAKPLQWLLAVFADQELNKRFHLQMQHAETSHTGKEKDEFVILKSKQIREQSELRSSIARALAGSTLLLAMRKLLQNGEQIPWPASPGPGSLQFVFQKVASLFRTASHTIEPPWVRPTPAQLTLYAAEMLHLLHHTSNTTAAPPFRIRDDAARAITQLEATVTPPVWGFDLSEEDRDTLATDFVTILIDLNLTLPPDPDAKHAPTTLSDATDDNIQLGCLEEVDAPRGDQLRLGPAQSQAQKSATRGAGVIPREVIRLLNQSDECLRWNAALALYTLGMDLVVVCGDGLQRSLGKWRRRGEQAKILVVSDLIAKANRAQKISRPVALGPPSSD